MRGESQLCDKNRKMKGSLVTFDKTYTLLNLLCIGLYCVVVKQFRVPIFLRNVRLSFKLSKCIMIISMIDEVYRWIVIV